MNKKAVGISIITASFLLMALAIFMACFTATVDSPLYIHINDDKGQKVWIKDEVKPFRSFSIPCSILGFIGVCLGIVLIFRSSSDEQSKKTEKRPRKGKTGSKAKKAK